MPQLVKTQKSIVRTAETPGVYMSPGTYSRQFAAAESLGRQISNLGAEFADAGYRLDRTERYDEFAKGQIAYRKMYNEHLANQLADPEYAEWPQKYDQAHKEFASQYLDGVRHPGARKDLEEIFDYFHSGNRLVILTEASKRKTTESRGRIPAIIDDYIQRAAEAPAKKTNEIRKLMQAQLEGMEANGTINEGELYSAIDTFDKGIEPVREARIFANAAELIKQIPTREQAERYIDDVLVHALKREQRNDLQAIVNRRFDMQEAQAKQKIDADKDKAEEEIWDIARAGNLNGISDRIDSFPFEPEWKEQQLSKAHSAANLIIKRDANPYTTRLNDEKYWQMFNRILDDPENITDDQMRDGVGKFWTINDYKEFRNMKLDDKDELRTPQAKTYFAALDTIYTNGKMTLEQWDNANRQMSAFFRKKPDASPKEIAECYDEIIKPYIRDRLSKFFDWIRKIAVGGLAEEGKAVKGNKDVGEQLLDIEPNDYDDFKFETRRIAQNDKELAKKFYEKWKHKWK